MKIETLRWFNDRLEMIDQRILPAAFEYLSYYSAASVAEGIRSMVVRGAPAIGVAAAYGVALEALRLSEEPSTLRSFDKLRTGGAQGERTEFDKGMEEGFTVLAASRPTAVNLFWALQRMRKVWVSVATQTPQQVAQRLLAEAHEILAEDIRINKAMGANGAALLKDGARVLTHCNAGALATAGWGTALGVFRSAVEAGKKISVIADETRPFLQGARLTAWEMVQENIPVTLITDNMAGHLMAHGEVDAVVVGTDRVAANGDVANKIGTYMVAVLAKRHNIPFYVACPLSTIDLNIATGADIPIEERSVDEVKGFRDNHWAAQGVKIRNPAFDVTPAELVTGLITEKGVILQPDVQGIRKLMAG
ncbi:S-methyl-5-thioribose-1-phosphate isomerase [Sideroxydans lithotrophicus]|uniref:Methylthioribose-1-phosphate isomerase n=1 Tax=Sideroxydans lithotrophicus (strain ES-1) TaxID=580332 RepID=D5CRY0_SIDLE|nr:S-methyl-5-thioribose-1-phosphate isomerase [Sideroxydans lithotrophicus]ADE11716.1 translation initiation factor, aIF-2BI family [Sideroxydans lithotrophicus ES-1]